MHNQGVSWPKDKFEAGGVTVRKQEVIHKLGERKKMFEDYLELVRRQPRLPVNKDRPYRVNTPRKAWK